MQERLPSWKPVMMFSAQCVLYKNIKSETDVIIVLQQYTVSLLVPFILLKLATDVWEGFISWRVYIYGHARLFQKSFTKRQQGDFRVNPPLPLLNETQLRNRDFKMHDHSDTLLGIKPRTTNQSVFNVFAVIWNVIASELICELLISFWIIATFNVWCYVVTFNHFLSHTYPISKMKTYCCQIPGLR